MLELQSIFKTWQPRRGEVRQLLGGVSLTVLPGETVGILGASGSGKSTLLKIVVGLEAVDSGSVWFAGQDISSLTPERRRFALMFQDFALFPHLSVQDNVAFGLVEQGQTKANARAAAFELLQRFGLEAFATSRIARMSGGEQQRVALARALITRPKVLLLDEPFSALDTELRLSLREEFRQRIAAQNIATILVTHDESEARSLCQRCLRLTEGVLKPA